MGCTSTKPENVDAKPIMVRYTEQKLNMPFSSDTENSFEKEIFFAINLLRNNPRSFIPHVQRVHQKNLCKGSKSMGAIIQILKNMANVTTVKFEDDTHSEIMTKITNGVFLVLFFNTGLLITLINANYSEVSTTLGTIFNGVYYDFSPTWYAKIGQTLVHTMLLNAFMPIILEIEEILERWFLIALDSGIWCVCG